MNKKNETLVFSMVILFLNCLVSVSLCRLLLNYQKINYRNNAIPLLSTYGYTRRIIFIQTTVVYSHNLDEHGILAILVQNDNKHFIITRHKCFSGLQLKLID